MDTMLKIALLLVLCGIPVMAGAEIPRRKTVRLALKDDPAGQKKILRQPLLEVLFGVIVTFAVLVFARICVVGTASDGVAVGVAYAAAIMCSIGAFIRTKVALGAFGLSLHEKRLQIQAAVFSVGMALLLCGLLTGFISLWRSLVPETVPAEAETAAVEFASLGRNKI